MSLHLDATRVEQSAHLNQNKPANLLHVLSGQIAYSRLSGLILRHFKILKDEKQNEKKIHGHIYKMLYVGFIVCFSCVAAMMFWSLIMPSLL